MAPKPTKPADNSKNLKRLIYFGGALVLGVVFWPSSDPPKATAKTTPKTKTASGTDSILTKEDYDPPPFPPLMLATKNVFVPLIAKQAVGGPGSTNPLLKPQLGIPPVLAGNEGGWQFTGTAEVNNSTVALLENKNTGSGDFLHPGERWKTSTVTGINDNELFLKGPDGQVKRILIEADQEELLAQQIANSASPTAAVNNAAGIAPVNPQLTGQIGGGLAVQPDPNAAATTTITDTGANGNGYGRGRGNGRGRGGRGNRGGGNGGGNFGGFGGGN